MKCRHNCFKFLLILVAVTLSGCVVVPVGGYERGDHQMDREGGHGQHDQDGREGDRRRN
jgi:hypothetical protein